ncbi:ribonuclease MRP protein subunit POP4 isoform X2 [Amaranthus tricolor]|uniref:ribonuclease MRP protein subunit POP4 isoform X2 n=1 Tax=Amaranthus tricolor TaxID=29722 RepID=UPI00258F0691|nr:ribonuclease MRP protein subunit POP4 isoform X2 [Amaranthus tricolor]
MMATKTIAEDPKKRAREALERRFALAKAELKKCRVDSPLSKSVPASSSALVGSSIEASPAIFPKYPVKKDLEADGLTYSCLGQPVHLNLLTSVEICDKDKPSIDKILHELLQKGDSAQKYIQGSRSIKWDNWILLDNFVRGNSTFVNAFKANSKRSKKQMSMVQLKKRGLLDLPQELHKFVLFMPMHEMWKTYVTQLLKNAGKNNVAQSLLVADLHGAIFRVVPKRNSIFVFQADNLRITLHGDKYTSRKLDTS